VNNFLRHIQQVRSYDADAVSLKIPVKENISRNKAETIINIKERRTSRLAKSFLTEAFGPTNTSHNHAIRRVLEQNSLQMKINTIGDIWILINKNSYSSKIA
jgi:hypothetical protein